MKIKFTIMCALLISGCAATGTNGVISTGENQYMVGGLGKFTDFSGSVVKARFIGEAKEFCAQKNQQFEMVSSTSKDVENGHYASAEIIFKCIPSK